MLVHPDKNMGSPLASESFKKLQSAYEVIVKDGSVLGNLQCGFYAIYLYSEY
jgi:hypothetical protein